MPDDPTPAPADKPRATVIIPVHNGARDLPRALAALPLGEQAPVYQVIVADDASTDESAEHARAAGAEVVRTGEQPRGPAAARNLAASQANAGFLVFIDSDVVVHADTIDRLLAPMEADTSIRATMGSYDDRPASRNVAALYANLRHHWTHQHANREAGTFWAGCGAIRRDDFAQLGGFNTAYTRPAIEDIELGMRLLAAGGRIRLLPEAQATHLKAWTVRQLWRTDIRQRAIPWARLMAEHRHLPNDLNSSTHQRIVVLAAHGCWISLIVAAIWPTAALLLLASCFTLWAGLSASLLRLLWKRGGLRGLMGGAALHWCYHLYASVTVAAILIGARR
jgi:GT2 family glycosyltransferase